MKNQKPEWLIMVELLEKFDQILLNRIIRRMFIHLYKLNIKDVLNLMKELEPYEAENRDRLYANVPYPKISQTSLRKTLNGVFKIAENNLSDKEIVNLLKTWISQERTRFLSIAVEQANISMEELRDALDRFFNIPRKEKCLSEYDYINIRVSLIHRLLSNDLKYINIAKKFITVRDFHQIIKNVVGPLKGSGKLGGKSAGIILASRILKKASQNHPELADVKYPKSWFITHDTTMSFIHYNALEELTSIKYEELNQVKVSYPMIKQIFKNSFLPSSIVKQLEGILAQIGDHPVIVRSSSLLEDSFAATFSGKYKSLFLTNTGTPEERLAALQDAIFEIMASIFGPDPLEYRRKMNLLDFSEEMGILIQEVVGKRVGNYFFPSYAGVAYSYNEFRWSPRIAREDGMVRLVAGLGTRAVDRLTDDYPQLASPGKPGMRVNVTYDEIIRYSQKYIDVLDLNSNTFLTLPFEEIFKKYGDEIPELKKIVSIEQNGFLTQPVGALWDPAESNMVITFQGLLDNSDFLKKMHLILQILEKEFETPVDVEFAHDGKNLYILQCRPQGHGMNEKDIDITEEMTSKPVFFSSRDHVSTGYIPSVKYIVYVEPDKYSELPDIDSMKKVAYAVAELNKNLPNKKFILIGPGRWGSRGDIKLGVQVTYSDVNNTAMLIEMAVKKGDYIPELSFGTHFFQDLVETGIKYLPIYTYKEETVFDAGLFGKYPNRFEEIAPKFAECKDVIKVIKTDDVLENGVLKIIMNADKEQALAFFDAES